MPVVPGVGEHVAAWAPRAADGGRVAGRGITLGATARRRPPPAEPVLAGSSSKVAVQAPARAGARAALLFHHRARPPRRPQPGSRQGGRVAAKGAMGSGRSRRAARLTGTSSGVGGWRSAPERAQLRWRARATNVRPRADRRSTPAAPRRALAGSRALGMRYCSSGAVGGPKPLSWLRSRLPRAPCAPGKGPIACPSVEWIRFASAIPRS